MVEEEKGTVRAVAWSELLPWLSIFRTFRLAIGVRVLLLGSIASFITILAWVALGWIFSRAESLPALVPADARCPWISASQVVPDRSVYSGTMISQEPAGSDDAETDPSTVPAAAADDDAVPTVRHRVAATVESSVYGQISRPFYSLFSLGVSVTDAIYLVLCGLASLAIWAFFGGAITRLAAVQLACDERIGLMSALRFACRKWGAYFAAPLFPLVGVLVAALPIVILGLLLNAPVGILLAGLVWPLALLGGLMMAVLLLGLMFGWPLMWTTISAEGTDSFDALSRAYAYVFQRPLQLLFYVAVAVFLGTLGWLLVSNFAAAVVGLAYWAASWGSSAADIAAIIDRQGLGPVGNLGAVLILFWAGCVKLLAVGFLSSYFWVASTAIYFLLRRDVDATEMDEVFLEEDEDQQTYGLPPMTTDQQGAPIVTDEEPTDDTAN